MHVNISGTSNAVMRAGYTLPLKERFGAGNYSIGVSYNCVFTMHQDEILKQPGGLLVIDFAANDEMTWRSGILNVDIADSHFLNMLARCAEQDVLPIVLIMPSTWGEGRHGAMRQRHRDLAEEFGLPLFDGFEYIERLYELCPELERFGKPWDYHIQAPLARVLGRSLCRALESLGEARRRIRTVPEGWRVDALRLAGLAGEKAILRMNSLARFNFARLGETETLRVETGPDAETVGFALNMNVSTATLELMGDERQLIILNNQYVGNPSTFRLAAWHLRRPLPSASGFVDLTCRGPRCDGSVIVCEAARPAGPEAVAVMELESLFVRRRQRDAGVIGLDRSIDLVSALSPADIRADKSTELFPDEDVTAAVASLASEK